MANLLKVNVTDNDVLVADSLLAEKKDLVAFMLMNNHAIHMINDETVHLQKKVKTLEKKYKNLKFAAVLYLGYKAYKHYVEKTAEKKEETIDNSVNN